jgi:hypothetical protein
MLVSGLQRRPPTFVLLPSHCTFHIIERSDNTTQYMTFSNIPPTAAPKGLARGGPAASRTPPAKPQPAEAGSSRLNRALAMLKSLGQIALGGDAKGAQASGSQFDVAVREEFAKLIAQAEPQVIKTKVGDIAIDKQMWLDMGRSDIRIQRLPKAESEKPADDKAESEKLVDDKGWSGSASAEQDRRCVAGVVKLFELADGNAQLLMATSTAVSQKGLNAMTGVLMSQNSPIRLPDGKQGSVSGICSETHTIAKDSMRGGLTIKTVYTIESANIFISIDGETVKLEPEQSRASFEYSLHIDPKGGITMPQSIKVDCRITPVESAEIAGSSDNSVGEPGRPEVEAAAVKVHSPP